MTEKSRKFPTEPKPKLLKRCFYVCSSKVSRVSDESHKKNCDESDKTLSEYYTVWKLWEFSLTHFWQKFRENSGFRVDLTKYFFGEKRCGKVLQNGILW